jgi:Trypsin-co-occurring domain 2
MTNVHPGFTLSQIIEGTADELRELKRKPRRDDAVMQFTECEVELAVTLQAEAQGKMRFWLVDASSKVSGETVSRVKIKFGPADGFAGVVAVR